MHIRSGVAAAASSGSNAPTRVPHPGPSAHLGRLRQRQRRPAPRPVRRPSPWSRRPSATGFARRLAPAPRELRASSSDPKIGIHPSWPPVRGQERGLSRSRPLRRSTPANEANSVTREYRLRRYRRPFQHRERRVRLRVHRECERSGRRAVLDISVGSDTHGHSRREASLRPNHRVTEASPSSQSRGVLSSPRIDLIELAGHTNPQPMRFGRLILSFITDHARS